MTDDDSLPKGVRSMPRVAHSALWWATGYTFALGENAWSCALVLSTLIVPPFLEGLLRVVLREGEEVPGGDD